ncbi:MAG: YdcH family protein [Acidobacteriota bacterium]
MNDEELQRLFATHHALDDRLGQLTAKPYLTDPEHVEEVTLKKQKLWTKDRMEDILRRHRPG